MKFLKLLFVLLSFSVFGQEVEVVIVNSGVQLKGSLIHTSNKDIGVLIIAGSGPTDRNGNSAIGLTNNSLKMLAEELKAMGISSLRYDKRGIAESRDESLTETELVFEDFVSDANSCVDFIISKGYRSVVIMGHSQGSLVGMLVAQSNTKVVGFVSIAGAGQPIGDTLVEQIGAQIPALGEEARILMDSITNGFTPKKINPFLVSVFRPSIFPFLRTYGSYDPAMEVRKLTVPVLIVNGTTDIQVGVEHAEMLSDNTSFELKIYEGMNHVLKQAPSDRQSNMATYNQPDLPLYDGLVDDLVQFINTL